MRISIIGSSDFDTLEYHIADSFTHMGHKVANFDYPHVIPLNRYQKYELHLRRLSDPYCKIISEKVAKKVIKSAPDLIIATYRDIHPAGIDLIRKEVHNIPIIHINPDALTTFERQQVFASDYDFYFSKDRYIVNFMRNKMNLNAFFLAECYNDRICKSRFTSKEEAERAINCDVFIYGNLYPYRYKMIEELISKGINVKIFGFTSHYFPSILKPNYYYPVFGQEKCDMIFGSKIVFNNFHYAEIGSVNEKYFVINGSGGFQICDQKDEVKDFSAVDIERFTFKNIQHAIDLIKYYLKNQSERLEIAKIQQKNCAQYHTYDIRMQQLLNIIFS